MMRFSLGECVKIPDGRIGRVRGATDGKYQVRVMRTTSHTHQFLSFSALELVPVACPRGWMSVEGYNRYLKATLTKMTERKKKAMA